jgi:hypothetical protein
LADAEGSAARNHANEDRPEAASPGVEGPDAGIDPDKPKNRSWIWLI